MPDSLQTLQNLNPFSSDMASTSSCHSIQSSATSEPLSRLSQMASQSTLATPTTQISNKLNKNFGCPLCPYITYCAAKVKLHIVVHASKKLYYCSKCEKRSYWSSDVKKHIRIIHLSDASVVKCPIAQKEVEELLKIPIIERFKNSLSGAAVKKVALNSTPVHTSRSSAEKSLRIQANSDKVESFFRKEVIDSKKCRINPLYFKKLKKAKLVNASTIYCQYCPYFTNKKKAIKNHLRFHFPRSDREYFSCPFCFYHCEHRRVLRQHLFMHVTNVEKFTNSSVKKFCTSFKPPKNDGNFSFPSSPANILFSSLNQTSSLSKSLVDHDKELEHSILDINNNKSADDATTKISSAEEIEETLSNSSAKFHDSLDASSQLTNYSSSASSVKSDVCKNSSIQSTDSSRSLASSPLLPPLPPKPCKMNDGYDIRVVWGIKHNQYNRMFKCPYCSKLSTRRANIRLHISLHEKVKNKIHNSSSHTL